MREGAINEQQRTISIFYFCVSIIMCIQICVTVEYQLEESSSNRSTDNNIHVEP